MAGINFQVSRSAANTHSWNSSNVGLYKQCIKALQRPRCDFQGIKLISQSRPSYSCVKNWAPISRWVANKGEIRRAPTSWTTWDIHALTWSFKKIKREWDIPMKGLIQTLRSWLYEANMTACGFAWLMIKWLTLNISLNCCMGKSDSILPSLKAAPTALS